MYGRRRFLAGASALAVPVLAACAAAAPTAAPKPAEPKPAAAPTSTPAAAAAAKPTEAPKPAADAAKPAAEATKPAAAAAQPAAQGQAAPAGYALNKAVQGNINLWHWWGSPLRRNAIRRVVGGFQQEYPNVKVTETFVPWGDIWTKNIAAVAAGSGMPEVCMETQDLRDRANKNICISLADLARRDKVTGELFWPSNWQGAVVNGQPYGLPFETNVSVYFYNKNIYKDAGLDPEKPPKDWNELVSFAEKMDKKSGDRIERLGFQPIVGGPGLDTWAINNGGEWQDQNFNPTINRKENVEALDWIKKWYDRHPKPAVDALQGTFGPQGPQDRFMSGKLASVIEGQSYVSFLNLFNAGGLAAFQTESKERLGWGLAPMVPAPGKQPAHFAASFNITIPRGVKLVDQAWEYVKYQAFVGQQSWARDTYHIPTVKELALKDPGLNADPMWSTFIKWMDYGKPGVFNPHYPSMLEVLNPARDAVITGKQTAQQALDEAQKKAEAEIAKNKT